MKPNGGSRSDGPLLRDPHGYPVVLGGQGRSPERVGRDADLMAAVLWTTFVLVVGIGIGAVIVAVWL